MKVLIINGSPRVDGNTTIASSQYWEKGEANKDLEGLQTMRVLARNMSFLLKSIALGTEKYGLPKTEEHQWTHLIWWDWRTYTDFLWIKLPVRA